MKISRNARSPHVGWPAPGCLQNDFPFTETPPKRRKGKVRQGQGEVGKPLLRRVDCRRAIGGRIDGRMPCIDGRKPEPCDSDSGLTLSLSHLRRLVGIHCPDKQGQRRDEHEQRTKPSAAAILQHQLLHPKCDVQNICSIGQCNSKRLALHNFQLPTFKKPVAAPEPEKSDNETTEPDPVPRPTQSKFGVNSSASFVKRKTFRLISSLIHSPENATDDASSAPPSWECLSNKWTTSSLAASLIPNRTNRKPRALHPFSHPFASHGTSLANLPTRCHAQLATSYPSSRSLVNSSGYAASARPVNSRRCAI